MLIRPAELAGFVAGDGELAFRRWDRPRLGVGPRLRTAVGCRLAPRGVTLLAGDDGVARPSGD